MASSYTVNSSAGYTLLERAKATIDGKTAMKILEVMNQRIDDFLKDTSWFECNMGLQHRIRRRTTLPVGTLRKFYGGVAPESTQTQIVLEPTALNESRLVIDEDELDTLANGNMEWEQQVKAFIQGMGQRMVYYLFNASQTSGAEYIDGLKTRLNPTGGGTIGNVFDNGETAGSTCTSIYAIEWGPEAVSCIYPTGGSAPGSTLGVIVRNKGREPQYASDSVMNGSANAYKTYYAYVAQFKQWMGLAVLDQRKYFRICNINADPADAESLNENKIIEGLNKCRLNRGSTRFYCNPTVKTMFDIKLKDKGNVNLSIVDAFGVPVTAFQGIPIRVVDDYVITNNETATTVT